MTDPLSDEDRAENLRWREAVEAASQESDQAVARVAVEATKALGLIRFRDLLREWKAEREGKPQ